jgi:hypothetical protein
MMNIVTEIREIEGLIIPNDAIFMLHEEYRLRGYDTVKFLYVGHIIFGHTNYLHLLLAFTESP